MKNDGLLVAVCPNKELKSVVVEPSKLLEDLLEEMKQYE